MEDSCSSRARRLVEQWRAGAWGRTRTPPRPMGLASVQRRSRRLEGRLRRRRHGTHSLLHGRMRALEPSSEPPAGRNASRRLGPYPRLTIARGALSARKRLSEARPVPVIVLDGELALGKRAGRLRPSLSRAGAAELARSPPIRFRRRRRSAAPWPRAPGGGRRPG